MAYKDPKPSDVVSGASSNKGDTGSSKTPSSTAGTGKGDKLAGFKETRTSPVNIKPATTKPISITAIHRKEY